MYLTVAENKTLRLWVFYEGCYISVHWWDSECWWKELQLVGWVRGIGMVNWERGAGHE